jgi:hypothetical protein
VAVRGEQQHRRAVGKAAVLQGDNGRGVRTKASYALILCALLLAGCGSHRTQSAFSKDEVVRVFAKHGIRLQVAAATPGQAGRAILRYVLAPARGGTGVRALYVFRSAAAASRTRRNLRRIEQQSRRGCSSETMSSSWQIERPQACCCAESRLPFAHSAIDTRRSVTEPVLSMGLKADTRRTF